MKSSILIHPEELSRKWIDRMADAGVDILGLHPVGGKGAAEALSRLLEQLQTAPTRELLDYAVSRGLEIEYEMHAVGYLLPRTLFDSHPEYFRMNEQGERTPDRNLCVSCEEAVELVAVRAAELAQALYRSRPYYYFWMDDTRHGKCYCPRCQSLSGAEQQLILLNRMQRELRKTIPHARLAHLAYLEGLDVPQTVKPEDGIFLEYAPFERYQRTPDPTLLEKERTMMEPLLDFFGRDGAKVLEYWLDNSLFSGWKKPPIRLQTNADTIRAEVSDYRRAGFESVSTFGCFLGEDYEALWGEPDVTPFSDAVKACADVLPADPYSLDGLFSEIFDDDEPLQAAVVQETRAEDGSPIYGASREHILLCMEQIQACFAEYKILIHEITHSSNGPTVTRFTVRIEPTYRMARATALPDELALRIRSYNPIRMVIRDAETVWLEIPNDKRQTVYLKDLEGAIPTPSPHTLPAIPLGVDPDGQTVTMQLERLPHLLVAGTTGSGKSIFFYNLLQILLKRCAPSELQLLLVDLKRVEFYALKNSPHLFVPICEDFDSILHALESALTEMERRFDLLAASGTYNLIDYRKKTGQPMPYLLVLIDEFADLMFLCSRKHALEQLIARLAQKGRAVGIHLVIGTQRPSSEVLTPIIKTNFPSRLVFRTVTQLDSRRLLGIKGAETLLMRGDLLFAPAFESTPIRLQGAFSDFSELESLV